MDAVITYVDGNDPLWQEDYARYAGAPAIAKRYRDWGTLKYLLRGIERFMPFVRKVHLVVARESQVPSWISDEVNVVLHSDIMPAEMLPTFNSTAIEMFLHRIPGLADKYLYFNDDMFPVRRCSEEAFFPGGKAAMGFSRHLLALNWYKKRTRNADRLSRKALGMGRGLFFMRPQHICSPMLRPDCEELYGKMESEILPTVSRLRTPFNLNQYLYLDYSYHKGTMIRRRISNVHISLALWSPERISRFLSAPTTDMACINDVDMKEEDYERKRPLLLAAFENLLPTPSKFEK